MWGAVGIMLGIAKSSLHVPVQMLAFCFAMVGFFFAKLYGHSAPHLYKGNSHHTLGWILFLFLIAQMSVGVVRKVANAIGRSSSNHYERLQEEHHQSLQHSASSSSASSSSDSGSHGATSDRHSEASGETLHMNEFEFDKHHGARHHYDDEDQEQEQEEHHLVSNMSSTTAQKEPIVMRMFNAVSPYIPSIVKNSFVMLAYNPFTKVVCRYFHMIMGRTFIVLIFVQTLSGLVVYHGVCR